MSDCVFCKIVSGEIPSYKIFENDRVLAFLDIAKDAVGHTLVIPKKHSVNILDCDSEDLRAVADAVQLISKHFVDSCGFSGVNILNASGKSAEQSVFHLHFHIIPRKKDDGISAWSLNDKFEMDLGEICKRIAVNQ